MKTIIFRTPQQLITAIEEKILIEELVYKGTPSALLGEFFKQMPHLKKITLGENRKYSTRKNVDFLEDIPNIEEINLFQDAISALAVLGYKAVEADKAVSRAMDQLGPKASLEDIIKKALSG